MEIAKRVYSLTQEENDPALMIGAYRALAVTLYFLGDFGAARQYAMRGLEIWRSGGVQLVEESWESPVVCLACEAMSEWYLGEIVSYQTTKAESILLAKERNDTNGLAIALYLATLTAGLERNPAEVERFASELIELSTRYDCEFSLPGANILRGWARSVSGDTVEGIPRIEQGIEDYRATGAIGYMPMWLSLKAEALHLADRTSEALEVLGEAEAQAKRLEVHSWYSEHHRLRAVFLAAMGAGETQIETSFCEAISIAKEQKSVLLENRAEATYAEYRRQKASASGGHRFRLPL